jgi:hypothetical protein
MPSPLLPVCLFSLTEQITELSRAFMPELSLAIAMALPLSTAEESQISPARYLG